MSYYHLSFPSSKVYSFYMTFLHFYKFTHINLWICICDNSQIGPLDEWIVQLYHWWHSNMHQWWYADAICLFKFLMIFLILNVFINIHENANYADKIICICHKLIKGQCLSFNLVPILVGCDKKQLRYYWFCRYTPILESHLNIFIHSYAN